MKHFIIGTALLVNMGLLTGCTLSGQKAYASSPVSCCSRCTCCKDGKCAAEGCKEACKGAPCECCKDNCCNSNECSRESIS